MGYYLYALHKFKWTPKQWTDLSHREKALVIASIDLIAEEEAAAQKDNN